MGIIGELCEGFLLLVAAAWAIDWLSLKMEGTPVKQTFVELGDGIGDAFDGLYDAETWFNALFTPEQYMLRALVVVLGNVVFFTIVGLIAVQVVLYFPPRD